MGTYRTPRSARREIQQIELSGIFNLRHKLADGEAHEPGVGMPAEVGTFTRRVISDGSPPEQQEGWLRGKEKVAKPH